MLVAEDAIKFSERGEVAILAELESAGSDKARLHFTVSGTGIAIPPEEQQRIFEAFCQADTSTTRKFGGAALALSISSRLVQMMGGRIWLESEAEHGSGFHFTAEFPIVQGAEQPTDHQLALQGS